MRVDGRMGVEWRIILRTKRRNGDEGRYRLWEEYACGGSDLSSFHCASREIAITCKLLIGDSFPIRGTVVTSCIELYMILALIP